MKLQLRLSDDGLTQQLITPNGEVIEGVVEIILPKIDNGDFPVVTVTFHLSGGVINLGGDIQ